MKGMSSQDIFPDTCGVSTHSLVAGAPARGGQGGQAPTLEKNRVGPAHPRNLFDRPF